MASIVSSESCWAQAVADLTARYALSIAAGRGVTITVIDLEPQPEGVLRKRLRSLAALMQRSGIGLCYLACPQPPSSHDVTARSTDELLLQWDAGIPDEAPVLWPTGERWVPRGPVVVLARGLWSRLDQHLMAAHYGNLFRWNREAQSGGGAWEKTDSATYPPQAPGSVSRYLESFNSFQFTLPVGALAALRAIARWKAQRWLVLAQGPGWAGRQDFRMPADGLLGAQRVQQWDLPVNFDWLGAQCPGAVSWQARIASNDVLQLLMNHEQTGDRERLAELAQPLASAPFSAAAALASSIRQLLGAGQCQAALAMLRLSSWDAGIFAQAVPSALTAIERTDSFHKAEWAAALHRVWDNRPAESDDGSFMRGFARAALACHQTELARRAVGLLNAGKGPEPLDHVLQAECLFRTGLTTQALALCADVAQSHTAGTGARQLMDRAAARAAAHMQPWRLAFSRPETAVQLEPLDLQHAEVLLYQYRDPQIAVMTGLPAIKSVAEARTWIEGKRGGGEANYALVHPELGFVGYIDLEISETNAFLCIWIGADFQGRGFAAPAMRLATDMAFSNGIGMVMSTVYDDNSRSLRALKSAGFRVAPLRGLPPHNERSFIYKTRREMPPEEAERQMIAFVRHTNPAIQFGEEICT